MSNPWDGRLPQGLAAVSELGEGDFCRAWLLEDGRVARVPKHAEADRAMAREARLLEHLAPSLPLPVPRPVYHRPEQEPAGEAPGFAVHALVPGVPLTLDVWETLPEPVRTALAARVGSFLRVLHGVDVAVGAGAGLESVDHAAWMRRWVRALSPSDGPIPPGLASELRAAFTAWLGEDAGRPYRPSILHADLSPGHVLVDPETRELTGIIDWGDAVVGDPARDFIFMYEDWGTAFLQAALGGYTDDPAGAARLHVAVLRHWLADQLDWTLSAWSAGRGIDFRAGVEALDAGVLALRAVLDAAT